MPKDTSVKKVMVIGSGPIVIGQAAEFDYAGTQACRALREEGIEVVLVNSNPATIMTDGNMADRVYIEPLTVDILEEIIYKEKPDGLLATMGGQVGLNLAKELAEAGILERAGVRLLGTNLDAIVKAEDRDLFKKLMLEINEPIPESEIVGTIEEAVKAAEKIGYPVIIRPAYTLGGAGGGMADNEEEVISITKKGIRYSAIDQVLVEKSVAGWKEIEYEVIRDSNDTCIIICNMENVDPVGVHTGDSIVVAPTQTLSDVENQMLRASSINIIRSLGIQGGCNVQFALNPEKMEYIVIEVNPRVSRSSALASKATGYPIARVATKIALGYHLEEIDNQVTGTTKCAFEPAVDYVIVKIPRWPFDKFKDGNRRLGSQMKATGEIMAIGRTFEIAWQKGIRSLELDEKYYISDLFKDLNDTELEEKLHFVDDERMFALGEAMDRGFSSKRIHDLTKIDLFFLDILQNLVNFEKEILPKYPGDKDILIQAKEKGYTDEQIAIAWGMAEDAVRKIREDEKIFPCFKMVDTCAGEFQAINPYYYSGWNEKDELIPSDKKKVVVLGSGPIRIGQGIEFDYCCVHSAWALKEVGYESVMINNNPETVSTDFDTTDRLFFEPLTTEDVMNIIDAEKPEGVIVQFGGQTAINLAKPLQDRGVKILGTTVEDIDNAEDREKFDAILEELEIPRPKGKTVKSIEEALLAAKELEFPLLVRPSYVLGGRAMEIVYNMNELEGYMKNAVKVSGEHPVLVDQYLMGKEIEVDAICDGVGIVIPGIMEHVERAGVHSGDSTAMYPPFSLTPEIEETLYEYTKKMALRIKTIGLMNVQYLIHQDKIYVIEVNPRSSRTVPYLSKVTDIPMVSLGTRVIFGEKLPDMGYEYGLQEKKKLTAVKMPVFSFSKLIDVETSLGPEMKSTGEVLGVDINPNKALYKALIAAGYTFSKNGSILATVSDKDKEEALEIMRRFYNIGFTIKATSGTAKYLNENGIKTEIVKKIKEGSPSVEDVIKNGEIAFVINTLTKGKLPERDGFRIRRAAVEFNIPCLTSLDLAKAVLNVLESMSHVKALQDYN